MNTLLNNHQPAGLNINQKQEISKMIDEKLNAHKIDINKKFDEIIAMGKKSSDDISKDIQDCVDRYKFKHNKNLAFWVWLACFTGSLMGYQVHRVAIKLITVL